MIFNALVVKKQPLKHKNTKKHKTYLVDFRAFVFSWPKKMPLKHKTRKNTKPFSGILSFCVFVAEKKSH